MLIDTHLHLSNKDYDDVDKVIKDALNNDIKYLVLGGTTLKDNIENINLSKKYPNVFLTLGYHPSEVNNLKEQDFDILEEQIIKNKDKVIAIGEIGLDYHYGSDTKEEQKELFEKQINIAKKYNLPVVIHTRDAIQDTYDILNDLKIKGVLHCFSGSKEMAEKFIKLGFYLGIGGVVTFKNSHLIDVIKEIGLNNIILETDSPYLSPFRGDKNEPKNIKIIANFLSDNLNISVKELANITTNNAIALFDLNNKI